MGRHRTPEEKIALGERARALRADGRSRREIMAELHVGEDLLTRLLDGTAVPMGLCRGRAKDDLRARAVELRLGGATYDQIAAQLGVSKASCSLWLRDLPRPEPEPFRDAAALERREQALRTRLRRDREARDADGRRLSEAAAEALGEISSRDLVVAFAVSYWCEGGKSKPWNRSKRVTWMNSDPRLVRLFLEGLSLLGVGAERIGLRVHIHETADESAARQWWSSETAIPLERFARSTIKRHRPSTNRKNILDGYRGCVCVTVRQSRDLYQVVEGLFEALTAGSRYN